MNAEVIERLSASADETAILAMRWWQALLREEEALVKREYMLEMARQLADGLVEICTLVRELETNED